MPAGISWPRYITATAAVMLSMLAGSQTVHLIYRPLRDLNDRVEIEKEKLRITKVQQRTSLSSDSNGQEESSNFSNNAR